LTLKIGRSIISNMNNEEKNQSLMPKDQVVVILEEIKSQNKIFGEKLSDVSEKVDLLVEDMDQVKSDMVDVKFRLKNVEESVKEIDGKLDNKAEKEIVDDQEKRIIKLEKVTSVV
jgi:hypothetical protein